MCSGKGRSRKPLPLQRVGRPCKNHGAGSLEMGSARCPWSSWRLPSLPQTLPGRAAVTVGNGFPVVVDPGRRIVLFAELALPHLLERSPAGDGGPVAAPAVANVQLDPAGRQEFPVPLDQLGGCHPVPVQQPLRPGCGVLRPCLGVLAQQLLQYGRRAQPLLIVEHGLTPSCASQGPTTVDRQLRRLPASGQAFGVGSHLASAWGNATFAGKARAVTQVRAWAARGRFSRAGAVGACAGAAAPTGHPG